MTEVSAPQPAVLTPAAPPAAAWSVRDAWLGLALALVLIVLAAFALVRLGGLPLVRASSMTIPELLFAIPPLVILALRRIDWHALGFRSYSRSVMGEGCGLMVGIYFVTVAQNSILMALGVETQTQSLFGLVNSGQSLVDMTISAVLVAPLAEEIFFRGFLFQGLRQGYGWKKAAIVSSLVFAAGHFQLAAFIPTFLMGYLFSMLYNRTNSIWPGVVLHFLMNALAMCGFLALVAASRLQA